MTTRPGSGDGDSRLTDRSAEPPWQQLKDELPTPIEESERADLLWQQLAAWFRWYDRAATRSRRGYVTLKVIALLLGGTVTVLAAISAPAGVTASLAAGIVAAEGLQQVFQLHANWISYRATAEELRQQAFLHRPRRSVHRPGHPSRPACRRRPHHHREREHRVAKGHAAHNRAVLTRHEQS